MKHSSEVTIIVEKSREVFSKIVVIDKAGPVVVHWRHAPHHEQALGQPVAWKGRQLARRSSMTSTMARVIQYVSHLLPSSGDSIFRARIEQ